MAVARRNTVPVEKLELYEKVLGVSPRIERKGDSVPYTSVNGHMFSYLNASGLMALRLPPAEREEFLGRYKTTLFHAYGIIQKEYVTVPDTLLKNTDELRPWVDMSYRYVSTMKPKAATRPAAKSAKAAKKAAPKRSTRKAPRKASTGPGHATKR